MRVLRRYGPVAAIVLAQIALMAVAPSIPRDRGFRDEVEAGTRREDAAGGAGLPVETGDAGDAGPTSTPQALSGGPAATTSEGSNVRAATASGSTPGGRGAPAGSTAHCVAGRQFDPAIDFHAPACVPRFRGPNGGATAQGVSGEEILLVEYFIDPGHLGSTFLREQGIAATEQELSRFHRVVEKFVNSRYELYGRKIRIELWVSPCGVQPPQESCFRTDAAKLVATKKPFAVVNSFITPASFFFDELSQRRTVNVGGWHFRDAFAAARRPYHWDPNISGTRMATIFAEWYCSQLHGRPVQYAGEPRPPERSFNGRPRVLGVVSLNDPENIAVVEKVLAPELARCGARVAHTYYIEPNVQRGNEQNVAAIQKLRSDPEATAVLCICGPAMALLHEKMSEQNYYPENLMPGNSLTDLDSVAQFFTGALGCPTRSNCQAENMFGLAQFNPQEPRFDGVGSRIWRAAGEGGDPPYARVDLDWTYWGMLASLIQGAGPRLTPAAMERGAWDRPAYGGGITGWPLRQFQPDSHSWVRDMRVVYWSTTQRSRYNGQPGTWVQVGPGRIEAGRPPGGALALPPKPR